jgi:hypothetical protein
VLPKGLATAREEVKSMTRSRWLAAVLAIGALAIPTTAAAGSFGPGNSDKGPHDPGAKCHPPGQTVDTPGCK